MDSKLSELYASMNDKKTVVTEGDCKMTVGTGITNKGGDLEGAKEKAKPIKNVTTTDNKVDKPEEDTAHSAGADDVEKGKGKQLKKESKLPATFEELYQRTLKEDLDSLSKDDEVVPAEDIEGDGFSDELGDFEEGEGEVDEEVDVATELRLMASRLEEMADKISGASDGLDDELGGEEGLDQAQDAVPGAEDDLTDIKKESVEPHQLKNAKKSSFGPKMGQKVNKSKISVQSGKGKTTTNGKDKSGKLSPAPKSTLGPNNSMTVKGSGPAVKGSNSKLFG